MLVDWARSTYVVSGNCCIDLLGRTQSQPRQDVNSPFCSTPARELATVEVMNVPDDLLYSTDHEWIEQIDGTVRIGITDYAQDALGDVVYVAVPAVGARVAAGDSFGEVESTKSVSDIYAPVTGVVTLVNDALASDPGALNTDPYGSGWLCVIEMDSIDELGDLLGASAYRALTEG